MEPVTGQRPATVLKKFETLLQHWNNVLTSCLKDFVPTERQDTVRQQICGYFHGELCHLTGRITFMAAIPDFRKNIVENLFRTFGASMTSRVLRRSENPCPGPEWGF